MKWVYRRLPLIIIFLFINCSLLTVFFLYKLPAKLVYDEKLILSGNLHQLHSSLINLNVFTAVSLFLAFLTIALLMLANRNSGNGKVTFINPFLEKTQASKQENIETEETEAFDDRLNHYKQLLSKGEKQLKVYEKVLWDLCKEMDASQGAVYLHKEYEDKRFIELYCSYAFILPESQTLKYEYGEGLAGQVAKSGDALYLDEVPAGYIKILSGLGSASPTHLAIIPMKKDNIVVGVTEIASFKSFSKRDKDLLANVLNAMVASFIVEKEAAVNENEL